MDIRSNMFDLTGKTALVTGGGYGLGRTLVHGLAGHGATVLSVARSADGLAETFSSLGPEHRYIVGDLTDDALYEQLDGIDEHIDILVNNAGGDPHTKPWGEQAAQEWRNTYEINVIAAERLCRLLTPKMVARGWGRVINVASAYGSIGQDARKYPARRRCGRVHGREARTDRPHPLSRVPARRDRRHRQRAQSRHDHLGPFAERGSIGALGEACGADARGPQQFARGLRDCGRVPLGGRLRVRERSQSRGRRRLEHLVAGPVCDAPRR